MLFVNMIDLIVIIDDSIIINITINLIISLLSLYIMETISMILSQIRMRDWLQAAFWIQDIRGIMGYLMGYWLQWGYTGMI